MSAGLALVVGFGNALVADDGVGPAVIARLREGGLPPGVRAEEGGQDALCLAGLWQGEPEIWLVDALLRPDAAGSIVRLAHQDVLALPQRHGTAHQLSLPECLRWLAHGYPEMADVRYRLWGIAVSRIELREGLSPQVAEAAVRLSDELRLELGRLAGQPGSPPSR